MAVLDRIRSCSLSTLYKRQEDQDLRFLALVLDSSSKGSRNTGEQGSRKSSHTLITVARLLLKTFKLARELATDRASSTRHRTSLTQLDSR